MKEQQYRLPNWLYDPRTSEEVIEVWCLQNRKQEKDLTAESKTPVESETDQKKKPDAIDRK